MSPIYAITPDAPLDISTIQRVLIQYNISILQYRRKITDWNTKLFEATQLKTLCDTLSVDLIINDDISLAHQLGCGVHLGKDDTTIDNARKILGKDAIIGASCYNNIELALNMQHQGVNYCGFGSVFASKTKPHAPICDLEIIQQASQLLYIPIVAIGGITFENMQSVLENGATSVAMIHELWNTKTIV
jgi:thiamine-phosphate pyrophosphorylase